MTGVERIAAERRRQITEEQWTPNHDATHSDGELMQAAQCYIWAARQLSIQHSSERMPLDCVLPLEDMPPDTMVSHGTDIGSRDWRVPAWPWDSSWWKPGADAARCLEKAGALVAAELDRRGQRVTP